METGNPLCGCGCGKRVPDPLVIRGVAHWRKYVDVSHRERAAYWRYGGSPPRYARQKARWAAQRAAEASE